MAGDLTWFKFRKSWIKVFKTLSKPEMDRLFEAIEDYLDDQECPDMVGRESVAWILIKAELDADKDSRRKAAEVHREAGAKGGRPKTNLDISETKKTKMVFEKPNETKKTKMGTLRVKSKELRDKSEDINLICADAQNTPAKADPEQAEFWQFAKEHAEMAETFHKETGLTPVKSQYGRWIKDLRDLAEAGITAEQMRKTITYMRSENLPVSSPGSLLKTAQWLKSRGSVPVKKQTNSGKQPDKWDAAAAKLKAELDAGGAGYLTEPVEVIDI